MSLELDRSKLSRLQREANSLSQKESSELKKVAEAEKKMFDAQSKASKAKSLSQMNSYSNAAERASRNANNARTKAVQYQTQKNTKTKEIIKIQQRISKTEADEQKKASNSINQANLAMKAKITELESQISDQLTKSTAAPSLFTPKEGTTVYDVFISHASEDKDEFVDPLALKCKEAGLNVWYDKFALSWGDSLRQSIDSGLSQAYFGIAVLSPNFFAKSWTNYELDGLLERALDGSGRLLPIWHRLTKDDLMKHAPSLAGRLALNTSIQSVDEIVAEMVKMRDAHLT